MSHNGEILKKDSETIVSRRASKVILFTLTPCSPVNAADMPVNWVIYISNHLCPPLAVLRVFLSCRLIKDMTRHKCRGKNKLLLQRHGPWLRFSSVLSCVSALCWLQPPPGPRLAFPAAFVWPPCSLGGGLHVSQCHSSYRKKTQAPCTVT